MSISKNKYNLGGMCSCVKTRRASLSQCATTFSDYVPSHHIMSKQLLDLGLIWKGEILWEKNNYNCKYTAWGSWKSPSMPYLKYTWEFVEVFSKETHKKPVTKLKLILLVMNSKNGFMQSGLSPQNAT